MLVSIGKMRTTISIGPQLSQVQFHSRDRRPLYQQLAEGIAAQIRNGALPLGTRLPPLRELSKRQAVALVTASQAYEALAAEGLVEEREPGCAAAEGERGEQASDDD